MPATYRVFIHPDYPLDFAHFDEALRGRFGVGLENPGVQKGSLNTYDFPCFSSRGVICEDGSLSIDDDYEAFAQLIPWYRSYIPALFAMIADLGDGFIQVELTTTEDDFRDLAPSYRCELTPLDKTQLLLPKFSSAFLTRWPEAVVIGDGQETLEWIFRGQWGGFEGDKLILLDRTPEQTADFLLWYGGRLPSDSQITLTITGKTRTLEPEELLFDLSYKTLVDLCRQVCG
jgi:hypothetical protein